MKVKNEGRMGAGSLSIMTSTVSLTAVPTPKPEKLSRSQPHVRRAGHTELGIG